MAIDALKSLRISSINYYKLGQLQGLTFVFSSGDQYPIEGTYKIKMPNHTIIKLDAGAIGRINFGMHSF